MSRFDAAAPQQSPVGSGVDVIDVAKQDVLTAGRQETRRAVYGFVDPYDYLIWLAVRLRAKLDPSGADYHERVAEDLERRAEVGTKKYGTRLKTNNGRNPLFDAYQEALDLLNYVVQARLEGRMF